MNCKPNKVTPYVCPVTREALKTAHRSEDGSLKNPETLFRTIASSGLDPAARPNAWALLLGCWDPLSDSAVRDNQTHVMLQQYLKVVEALTHPDNLDIGSFYTKEGSSEEWCQTFRRIGTDADRLTTEPEFLALNSPHRQCSIRRLKTLLAVYALSDPEIGYCQGMSDLAAPLLEIYQEVKDDGNNTEKINEINQLGFNANQHCENNSEKLCATCCSPIGDFMLFWCFSKLLSHMRSNFLSGMQSIRKDMSDLASLMEVLDPGLHRHLMSEGAGRYEFSFQMLLLMLRRELPWNEANQLWDGLTAWHHVLQYEIKGASCRGCRAAESGLSRASAWLSQEHLDGAPSLNQPAVSASGPLAESLVEAQSTTYPNLHGSEGDPCDLFRELRVACTASLLTLQRQAFLKCKSLEEIVQTVNRMPALAPGCGLRIARMAANIVRDRESTAMAACGCFGKRPLSFS